MLCTQMQYIETIILLPFTVILFILDMLSRKAYKKYMIADLKASMRYCHTNSKHRK